MEGRNRNASANWSSTFLSIAVIRLGASPRCSVSQPIAKFLKEAFQTINRKFESQKICRSRKLKRYPIWYFAISFQRRQSINRNRSIYWCWRKVDQYLSKSYFMHNQNLVGTTLNIIKRLDTKHTSLFIKCTHFSRSQAIYTFAWATHDRTNQVWWIDGPNNTNSREITLACVRTRDCASWITLWRVERLEAFGRKTGVVPVLIGYSARLASTLFTDFTAVQCTT